MPFLLVLRFEVGRRSASAETGGGVWTRTSRLEGSGAQPGASGTSHLIREAQGHRLSPGARRPCARTASCRCRPPGRRTRRTWAKNLQGALGALGGGRSLLTGMVEWYFSTI